MKVIIIAGRRKAGKTHLAKRMAKAILSGPSAPSLLVWDRNREWGQKDLPTIEAFTDTVASSRRSLVVIEDATIHFNGRHYNRKLSESLITCRHDRNTFILLFHSLCSIPRWIMEQADAIAVLRTGDNPGDVRSKFRNWPEVLRAFDKARESKAKHVHYYVQLG